MLTFITSGAAIVFGGMIMNWVNLGIGLVSIASVLTMIILEAMAWTATTTGKVTTSVYAYGEAISFYLAAIIAISGSTVSLLIYSKEAIPVSKLLINTSLWTQDNITSILF